MKIQEYEALKAHTVGYVATTLFYHTQSVEVFFDKNVVKDKLGRVTSRDCLRLKISYWYNKGAQHTLKLEGETQTFDYSKVDDGTEKYCKSDMYGYRRFEPLYPNATQYRKIVDELWETHKHLNGH